MTMTMAKVAIRVALLLASTATTKSVVSAAARISQQRQRRTFLSNNKNYDNPWNGFMRKSEIPSTGEEWISLTPGVEFQPGSHGFSTESLAVQSAVKRFLANDNGEKDEYYNKYYADQLFVESAETVYEGYQQAWRYIGFYVDCNDAQEEAEEEEEEEGRNMRERRGRRSRRHRHRHLNDGENEGCTRYLLWAAYIDPLYEGNGLAEYEFYDRFDDEWVSYCDDKAVCRKMDCHLPDTHFKLMGFFKHYDYDDWMEQLFKHEGVCVWTENEYEFMSEAEGMFPEGCSDTEVKDEEGNYLYYGLMPMPQGDLGLGLYTDASCSKVYSGEMDPMDVLAGEGSGDGDLEETYATFNSAFDVFKICQPCVAYDLANGFDCYDQAGYTNVNQCMKFRTKCDLQAASVNDVLMAAEQGSTQPVTVMHDTFYASNWTDPRVLEIAKPANKIRFALCTAFFCCSLFALFTVKRKKYRYEHMLRKYEDPLVPPSSTNDEKSTKSDNTERKRQGSGTLV